MVQKMERLDSKWGALCSPTSALVTLGHVIHELISSLLFIDDTELAREEVYSDNFPSRLSQTSYQIVYQPPSPLL